MRGVPVMRIHHHQIELPVRIEAYGGRRQARIEQRQKMRRAELRPGPLDEAGWTLLVPGGAAAAKLRQLRPALEAALNAKAKK